MPLFLRRAAAYLLDIVLLFLVLAPLAVGVKALLGVDPQSGAQIWLAAALGFSLPVWIYFAASDASAGGATAGKRLLGVAVVDGSESGRLTPARALVRTAFKLLPWELAHVFGFALAGVLPGAVQATGLVAANLLALLYLALAVASGGRTSLHDRVVGSEVVRRRGA